MSQRPDPSPFDLARDGDNRFAPGNAGGPGRPPGARNRASQRLILEILRDFELNRELVFHRLRGRHLPTYVSLVKAILPSREEIGAFDQAGDFDDFPLPAPIEVEAAWRAAECERSDAALRATLARERGLTQGWVAGITGK